METRIIISKESYDRLTDIEKNFDAKVKENEESFKKGLEDAIRGDLIKILWVKDKIYADIKGCDLSDEGICNFVRREDVAYVDKAFANESYDREKTQKSCTNNEFINDEIIRNYKKTIRYYKKAICKLWCAFGIMFVAWLITLIQVLVK